MLRRSCTAWLVGTAWAPAVATSHVLHLDKISQRWTDGSPTSQTSGIRESTTTHATLHLGFLLPVFPKIHLEEELVRLSSDSVLGRLVPHEVGILQPFLRTPPVAPLPNLELCCWAPPLWSCGGALGRIPPSLQQQGPGPI